MSKKRRGREIGIPFKGRPGMFNAITDVPGVEVGYTTIIDKTRPIRTGVTAVLPRGKEDGMSPVWAGTYNLNGNGEMTGTHWIKDGGSFFGPICITNSHSVGIAHHAVTKWMINKYRDLYRDEHIWTLPVIAETYDGVLNDINGQHIHEEHVINAIERAKKGKIDEGNVGGGTGMIAYEFKGGTGTSSRKLEIDGQIYHVGALVQANHGIRDWFTVAGVPIGKHLTENRLFDNEKGSIIVVIATDIPLLPYQLEKLAKRGAIGIGRSGTPGGNDSGDMFLAFSTANKKNEFMPNNKTFLTMDFLNDWALTPVYEAVCETIDEAIINAMLAAETMEAVKPVQSNKVIVQALDPDQLIEVLRKYNRLKAP